jgi:hypothetical protein
MFLSVDRSIEEANASNLLELIVGLLYVHGGLLDHDMEEKIVPFGV